MTFELNTTAQADQYRRAINTPLDRAEFDPGFFTGALTAPLEGVGRFGAKGALLAGEGMTPILKPVARSIDEIFGTSLQGYLDDERRKNVEVLKSLTPDPQTTGMAGQILNAVFDIVPSALLTGPAGAGILEGVAQKKLAEARGVDPTTATMHGVVQGVATGVGVSLPMSLGLRAAPDLLYAAASNVVPNMAARQLSHQILAAGGYTEMAAQFKALDMEAIAADAVLGLAFGGIGRVIEGNARRVQAKTLYSTIDAALRAQDAKRFEIDAAPGIPKDFEARDAHVEALTKATDDLIAGRAVEVPARVAEANFEPTQARAAVEAEVQAQTKPIVADVEEAARLAKAEEAPAPLARPDVLPEDLPGRVAHPDVQSELLAMRNETGWAQRGGRIIRDGEGGDVTGRTSWIPNAEWWPGRPDKMSEKRVQVAIDKALAGEALKPAEERLVKYLTDYIDERLLQPLRDVPIEEQNALRIELTKADLEPTPRNVVDVDKVAKASEIDDAAVERAAMQHESDDAGFMRAIQEILNREQSQKTGAGGEAGARAAGEFNLESHTDAQLAAKDARGQDAALSDRALADSELEHFQLSHQVGDTTPGPTAQKSMFTADGRASVDAARAVVAETPDFIVADETGALVRADELMAMAEDTVRGAEQDARGFEAAVTCFMRAAP